MDQPTTHVLQVLDRTGHTEVAWQLDATAAIDEAEAIFNEARAKGYRGCITAHPDQDKVGMMPVDAAFDPTATAVIMIPQLVGG